MIKKSSINPKVKYLTQRDNINPYTGKKDGHNQCMVASFVMLVNWLGDKYDNKSLQVYNEFTHLCIVGRNAEELEKRRYRSINHAEVVNPLIQNVGLSRIQLKSKYLKYDEMKKLSNEKKSPIIVGSMVTSYGHIIVYIGDNKFHDPYGKCSEYTLRYTGKGFSVNGAEVEYSEKFCKERIFRSGDLKTANSSRLCWYFEGIK